MSVRLLVLGAPVAAMTALGGCSSLSDASSYGLDPGLATYDALKAATDACKAKGGELRLKGGGPREGRNLSDYECAIGKAR